MKRLLIFSMMFFFIISISACKKKKTTEVDEPPPELPSSPVNNSQAAFKTGNYWIYDNYQTENGITSSVNQMEKT